MILPGELFFAASLVHTLQPSTKLFEARSTRTMADLIIVVQRLKARMPGYEACWQQKAVFVSSLLVFGIWYAFISISGHLKCLSPVI